MKKLILITLCVCFFTAVQAQVFTNKEVGKKNEALIDSLKSSAYPYKLPIWGEKATKAGFNLPYSAGLSVQYFGQVSDLIIDNLRVGFNNGTMYNLDGIVRFDEARATASAVTVRPDIWLFPFLNVYGLFGVAAASTEVGFGVWVPDASNTPQQILSYNTTVEFQSTTAGFGITPTIGVGGGFMALDMNIAWTDVPQLNKPARSFVFGPRFGKNFKMKKPNSSFAVWVGGFRVNLSSGTEGSIALADVLPPDFGSRIEQGMDKVDQAQQDVDEWWNGLSQAEQMNPVNIAKYNTANDVLERAGGILYAAESAANSIENSTVQYAMDKRPKDKWNFIVGSQYQFNKHFMVRAEVGFLASRTQIITGLQYRFGL